MMLELQMLWSSHKENAHLRLNGIDYLLCMFPFQCARHSIPPGQLCSIIMPATCERMCLYVKETERRSMQVYE